MKRCSATEALRLSVRYAVQERPNGLAEAFLIDREFVGTERVALILDDSVFFGHGPPEMLEQAARHEEGVTVFAYCVRDPQRYGVVELDARERAVW